MKTEDTATFNTKKYESTVASMRERGEEVHARGREVYRRTKRMDPLVDVNGKLRLSHNSFKKVDGKAVLVNGPALPIWSGFDGTGSMGENAGRAHAALAEINAMLNGIRDRYNPQLATSVIQDVDDPHPVFQMAQFEPDERIAEEIRLLIPDNAGGDETEDYQLALAYLMLATDFDIANFYGLKGYGFIVGDEIGREDVTVKDVEKHLGHKLQSKMTTKAVAKELARKMHLFYIHVQLGHSHGHSPSWWEDKFGAGHVLIATDVSLLAELQAGLIYVTETLEPTEAGLFEFLSAGGSNKHATKSAVAKVWSWITEAHVPFGAQVKLAGYKDLPKPGDVFENFRHQWPVGHKRFAENVIAPEATVTEVSVSSPKSERPNWERF